MPVAVGVRSSSWRRSVSARFHGRAVWGTAYADEGHYLHVYVSRLRRKLQAADPSGEASGLITAEPGIGYRIGDPDTAD